MIFAIFLSFSSRIRDCLVQPQVQKVCRVSCEQGEADNLDWQWRNHPDPAELTQKLRLFDGFCHFLSFSLRIRDCQLQPQVQKVCQVSCESGEADNRPGSGEIIQNQPS